MFAKTVIENMGESTPMRNEPDQQAAFRVLEDRAVPVRADRACLRHEPGRCQQPQIGRLAREGCAIHRDGDRQLLLTRYRAHADVSVSLRFASRPQCGNNKKEGRLIGAGLVISRGRSSSHRLRHASVTSYMEDACGVVARAESASVSSTYRARHAPRWIGENRLAGDSASA